MNWLIRFFPFFAIFSENEELKEQLAQLAETKVRIDYIILIIIMKIKIIIITVRSGQEAKCVNNLLSTIQKKEDVYLLFFLAVPLPHMQML